jgi:hypothetical protein
MMTDYNDHTKLKRDSASNMDAVEDAIIKGKEEQLQLLLTNILFDEMQKSYLISLAIHSGKPEIVQLLKDTPATP